MFSQQGTGEGGLDIFQIGRLHHQISSYFLTHTYTHIVVVSVGGGFGNNADSVIDSY